MAAFFTPGAFRFAVTWQSVGPDGLMAWEVFVAKRQVERKIDPTVDCVFKTLFGSEDNKDIALSFIRAMLDQKGDHEIEDIEFSPTEIVKKHMKDKAPVVDIRATDKSGISFQVEMQNLIEQFLLERIFYGWTRINAAQLGESEFYNHLKCGVSIWILNRNLFPTRETTATCLRFVLHCIEENITMRKGSLILLVQLKNFRESDMMSKEKAGWIRFLREGANIDPNQPPAWVDSDILKKAVAVLQNFANDKKAFIKYDRELNARRNTELKAQYEEQQLKEAEEARMQAEAARKQEEKSRKQAEAARKQEEKGRKQAEAARKQAEKGRKQAEKVRKQMAASLKHAEAEIERLKAELAHVTSKSKDLPSQ